MDEEDLPPSPEPNPDRQPIPTTDDDVRPCPLSGTGLAPMVKIMPISQRQGPPALCQDLDELSQQVDRLWARSRPADGEGSVAREVRAHCRRMLEVYGEDGRI